MKGAWKSVLLLCAGLALMFSPLVWTWVSARAGGHSWDEPFSIGWVLLSVVGFVLCGLALWTWAKAKVQKHDAPQTFLTPEEEEAVLEAIRRFETLTSGELHVHLSSSDGDVFESAKKAFETLGLTATQQRNGILFFVAVPQHKFAVLGDSGIHEKVGPEFWERIAQVVHDHFAEKRFGAGLKAGIELAGEALVAHFPGHAADKNELPDQISRR